MFKKALEESFKFFYLLILPLITGKGEQFLKEFYHVK